MWVLGALSSSTGRNGGLAWVVQSTGGLLGLGTVFSNTMRFIILLHSGTSLLGIFVTLVLFSFLVLWAEVLLFRRDLFLQVSEKTLFKLSCLALGQILESVSIRLSPRCLRLLYQPTSVQTEDVLQEAIY